ncbi:MAG: murein L,D-transpeptidase catalytic domain family protein [Chitinophagaceae bacterium]|nr:murein L,D-transpeptidase catalytic domain family protein [Chitinophagaceae bacterium]
MYRPVKSITYSLLSVLVLSPVLMTGTSKTTEPPAEKIVLYLPKDHVRYTANPDLLPEEASTLYDNMQLKKLGLTKKAFAYAWKGYSTLMEAGKLAKDGVLSICDFSQSSRRKRLYVLDIENQKLLVNTYVAHGRKSGGEYAKSFSNSPESHMSSLGFYVTRSTYYGEHGLALKIQGLERGFNDKADSRNIVIHGSQYVGKQFLNSNKFNGRSFGCPALPAKEAPSVIQQIKNGSCLFIYHPTKNYITQSRLLN